MDQNRPRAAHKLNLRDGDVVELVGWQDGGNIRVGERFTVSNQTLLDKRGNDRFLVHSAWVKGRRPLFAVVSHAADSHDLSDMPEFQAAHAKPDEVITIHKRDKAYRLTFPHGSDVGKAVREEL